MADVDDPQTQQAAEALGGEDTAIVTDLTVGPDGRVFIPKKTRERYGIEEGDFVDAVLVVGEQ